MCGTGIDVLPNSPRCQFPVILAAYTGGMPSSNRTEHTLACMLFKTYPLDYQLIIKVNDENLVSTNLKEDISCVSLRVILVRVRFRPSFFGEVAKKNLLFGCAN